MTLLRAWFENFYSYRDRVEIDLTVRAGAGERPIFKSDGTGGQVNRVLALFGANASGKSHALRALGLVRWLAVDAVDAKPGEGIPFHPFLFREEPHAVSSVGIDFVLDGDVFRYEVEFRREMVLTESLKIKRGRFARVFEREAVFDVSPAEPDGLVHEAPSEAYFAEPRGYEVRGTGFGSTKALPMRPDASLIATAGRTGNPEAERFLRYFQSWVVNFTYFGMVTSTHTFQEQLAGLAGSLRQNRAWLQGLNELLSLFDLGMSKLVTGAIVQSGSDGSKSETPWLYGQHEVGGRVHKLGLEMESHGTQSLVLLLTYLWSALSTGSIAIIDEFEAGLHPHVVLAIVELFYSERFNPLNAQLVFACHSDHVLGQLEKYQVVLVERDEMNSSHLWRLDQVKGLRNADNLLAKYHAGALGGIPNIG